MISLIVPAYNEEKIIEETLKELKVGLRGADCEIIVSDDQSADKTKEIAAKYADKVVEGALNGKRGVSGARNRGAAVAKGNFLIFLDADIHIPTPQIFLQKALEYFRDGKVIAIFPRIEVLPKMATVSDKIFYSLFNNYLFLMNNVLGVGSASGEFQMVRTSAFKEVGGYREGLVAGEDVDFFLRLAKLGKVKGARKLVVFNDGRRIHKLGWPRTLYRWIKSGLFILLFKKPAYKKWESIR